MNLALLLLFVPIQESFQQYVPPNIKIAERKTRPSAEEVIRHASSFLGTRYVWGSCEIPPGLDCSGFMIRVWSDMGYALPRVSRMQAMVGMRVEPDKLEPADLLFFTTDPGGDTITHVAMYIGNGEFIHAAMGSMKVSINSFTGYFRARFSHARRILPLGPGYIVEADQSQRIGVAKLPPAALPEPKHPPSKREKEAAEKLLAGIDLPKTGVTMPNVDEVTIAGNVVQDEDLARQLRGVDTNDPNQFEHAGQPTPPFFMLATDPFAGAALPPQGPRYLARDEHAFSLHAGAVTVRDPSARGAFYLSPELNLDFEQVGFKANLAFPVAWGDTTGKFGFVWGNTWRDYTRVLRQVQYGEPESAVYLALDRFATTTIGHGELVRDLSPSLSSLYLPGAELGHVPLTWHGDVNLEAASVETQIDDVLDPRLISGRLALRPWAMLRDRPQSELLRQLTFALEYAIDMGVERRLQATNMLSTDVELQAWRTRVHQTDVYAGTAFAVTGVASAPALAMAKGFVGTLWRFKLGQTAAHALRARAELGFGKSRDTWMDNFEYNGYQRSTSALSALVGLGYSYKQFFDIGSSYVPAMTDGLNTTPAEAAHKLESHVGLQNVPIDPRVRLNVQLIHQMLFHPTPSSPDAHYALADVHLIAWRLLKVGVLVRKPLSTDFQRWELMGDVAIEVPF